MSLSAKLQVWVENQLITPAQSKEILAFEMKNNKSFFWKAAFSIAALFIGLGICLIVASNWDLLPEWLKLAVDFAIFAALIYGVYWSFEHSKDRLKELFLLLCFLMIGASIGLIGQIFNLDGGWSSFAFAWCLLGIPYVFFSRAVWFNIVWLWILCSSAHFELLDMVFEWISHQFLGFFAAALFFNTLAYGAYKADKFINRYTVIALAAGKLSMFFAYISVIGGGFEWGMFSRGVPPYITLAANIFVFTYFGCRMLLAGKGQNLISFKRIALLVELYIFALFVSAFGDLFATGIGFILGGVLILFMIYVLRKTSAYIKKMEIFNE